MDNKFLFVIEFESNGVSKYDIMHDLRSLSIVTRGGGKAVVTEVKEARIIPASSVQ